MIKVLSKIFVNLITGIRLIGTCIIIPIYFNYGCLTTAIACLIIYLSDFFDGFLARHLHTESFFGSILDSVSDKLFTLTSLIILTTINHFFILIILTELGIALINKWSIDKGNHVESSFIGKAKTWVLAASIILTLLLTALEVPYALYYSYFLAIITLLVDLYVLSDYYKKAVAENNLHKEELLKSSSLKNDQILKTKKEILHDLFDTEYYLSHRQDKFKNIFYKRKQ